MDGTPGKPGLSAYNYTINGISTTEFLTAPNIIGQSELKNITAKEGDNLRLRCVATGSPKPTIIWQKLDTSTIPMGSWRGKFTLRVQTIITTIYFTLLILKFKK